MISLKGSDKSREVRVIARSKPETRYEVFRRTKGDLVRVCAVEVQKPLPAFIQTGPWRLERSASRAELQLPDLEVRIQQLGYYLFTAPEGRPDAARASAHWRVIANLWRAGAGPVVLAWAKRAGHPPGQGLGPPPRAEAVSQRPLPLMV